MAGLPLPDGLVLAPVRAVRPDVDGSALAGRTSPPYDVLDDAGVRRLEELDPYNIVRLILPRDDAGPGSRYRRAASTLERWLTEGALSVDAAPALYVYEIAVSAHVQRGLVGAVGLVPPEAGIVLPHEDTMAGPVADRLALTEATASNLEPIFLVYDGGGAASRAVGDADQQPPLARAETEDGAVHRLWALTDPDLLATIAADLHPRRAVIADGHHRYATYRQHQRDRHAAGDGPGPWDQGLALLVDSSAFGPQVHAIHRVIPGLAVAEATRLAASVFTVRRLAGSVEGAVDALAAAGTDGCAFVLTDGRQHHLLTAPDPAVLARALDPARSAAWRGLDVTVAHAVLIRYAWGLDDTETQVGYRHDVASAVAAAAESAGTALLLNPTPVGAVVAVAAAGERMPRKSTLFTPKPQTGLLLRSYAVESASAR